MWLISLAFAVEGMWLPEDLPSQATAMAEQGFTGDVKAWTDLESGPLAAIVSLGGCSASFVSADGLIVTNHHCVTGYLQQASKDEENLVDAGFLAGSRAEERSVGPGGRAMILQRSDDVTAAMTTRLPDEPLARADELERREKDLLQRCERDGLRCRVVGDYEGSQYRQLAWIELKDLRLVMAPPITVGGYGDQIDNWHWPRHSGDFAFLRAYVGPDGKPAPYAKENQPWKPRSYLPVAAAAPGDGAFVAVLGYPGRTFRWKTAAELDFAVATEMPQRVTELDYIEQQLVRTYTETPALKVTLSPWREGVANRLNKLRGMLEALRRPGLLEGRRTMEAAIRGKMAENQTSRLASDNLDRLQAQGEQRWAGDFAVEMVEGASRLFNLANQLDERALQRAKPDKQRLIGYQERDESRFLSGLETFSRRVVPGTDRQLLSRYLGRMMALPEGEGIPELRRWVQEQGGLESALERLYAAPVLMEGPGRLRVSSLTPAQLASEKDPFLQMAVALRAWRERSRREDKLRGGEAHRWRPLRAAALRSLYPRLAYPDANSTLRVTYGRIQGYKPRDGVVYGSRTTLAGLAAKAGPPPFDAPALLVEKAKQNPALPVNFVSDLDITGGNSGSATVDAEGRLVGLAFDGTWESIASDWIFDPEVNRTIHVDIAYIRWYLAEVAGAQALLAELGP